MPESKYCQKCGLDQTKVIYECIVCRSYHCSRTTCGTQVPTVCGECGNTLRLAK